MIPALITFKWKPKADYRSQFESNHVNMLYRGCRRFYSKLNRFICITDDPTGLDPDIETFPLWTEGSGYSNPTWPDGPACYPRLFVWSEEFARLLDLERFAVLDIDMVPTAPLDPIFDRTEPLLMWRPGGQRIPLCASLLMMNAGHRPSVWNYFIANPKEAMKMAALAGWRGSDQAWLTFCLGINCPGWERKDGVIAYSSIIPPRPDGHNLPDGHPRKRRQRHVHINMPITAKPFRPNQIIEPPHLMPLSGRSRLNAPRRRAFGEPHVGPLPENAKLVIFTGKPDPWDRDALVMSPWLEDYLR
jgi:hypothetical protein